MFSAVFSCPECGDVSETFVIGFIPDLDATFVAFQDMITNAVRTAKCTDISCRLGHHPVRFPDDEQAIDDVEREFVETERKPSERHIEIGLDTDKLDPLPCPKCGKLQMHVRHLGLI